MNVFIDFLQDLFSADGFPARWVCGRWTPFHGWLYILSSLAIWLAYFAIPLLLFLFLRKKKEVRPFGRIFWLFILFIFSCGLTHLADSIMFWIPVYRVSALLLLSTAIISWAAVITLFRLLPQLFALKSPAQVEAIMQKRFQGLTQELKKSEERWQFALEGSRLGVWDWNTDTNEVFFSKMWKEMLGYEPNEINSSFNEWERMVHPDDKTKVFEEIEKHISGNSPAYKVEHRLKCKDGNYKWILTSGMVTSRTPEGKALRLVGTHDDITTAKIQQEKLRISESTFSSAFHFSSIGLGLVAPTGLWLDVNPALCTLLGYSREELLEKTFQDITHPDDLHIDLDYVQQMLNREITTYQMEKRYFHRNGQIIWVLLSVSLVWELENRPKFFISQIVDISTIKHLMAELELKNETLQVNATDLAGKMQQLEEFNRIVAHNLRGPAGNIKMLLELLPDEVPEARSNILFEMVTQASGNLQGTLEELMKVLEVQLNKDIPYDACNVEEILHKTLLILKPQILEKNADISEDLQEYIIHYPKAYLESIIYNLLSNAVKYSRPQVIPYIVVKTYSESGQIFLSVKDNGLGIDLNKYGDHVFKLNKIFHQGFDSKGIGLFMTKNQIQTLGGTIMVKSKPMEGSEFVVKF